MSRLDGFEQDNAKKSTSGKPFFTVNHSAILFSKKAVEDLNFAEHVHVFFNHKTGEFAIQPCDADPTAKEFYKPLSDGRKSVRWSSKKYVSFFKEHAENKVSEDSGFRIYGEYFDDENVMIFDVKTATPT